MTLSKVRREMDKQVYAAYEDILREELVPAFGCTEPIAIALAGALVAKTLGAVPERIVLAVSGNIVKNVKSVTVPSTGGRKGIKAAVCAGICYGDPDKALEVLAGASDEQIENLEAFMETHEVDISRAESDLAFDIQLKVEAKGESAFVRIADKHTNVVLIKKNDQILMEKPFGENEMGASDEKSLLTIKDIVNFAEEVDLEEIRDVLERQIEYNMAIAEEGLLNRYGAAVGHVIMENYDNSIHTLIKAWAAAGSDARMGGCQLPVVINSGSGNQGITVSVPVVLYARENGFPKEKLLRALVISNLVAIRIKVGVGCLSAYCGATSAGISAGAGICYLRGGGLREIAHVIVNGLAINSGMICDGAKASCAAKIASAIEAGMLGMEMFEHGSQFYDGEGIVIKGVENTIDAIGIVASEGMRPTDEVLIDVMLGAKAIHQEKKA